MHRIEKTVVIAAPPSSAWHALTHPAAMCAWMGEPDMRIEVHTDWRPGAPIEISGFHHGAFRNRGIVLEVVPGKTLRYSHLSSVSRLPDEPEHYSVIAFELAAQENGTAVRLVVERFATESIYRHLRLYWNGTMDIFKAYVERAAAQGVQGAPAVSNGQLSDLLSARRHVGLRRLLAPGPDAAALERIMDAAAQAPDHGLLRPWRFVLVPPHRRNDLGDVFEEAQAQRNPEADDAARAAIRATARDKARRAPCLLVAILVDDPATPIPTAEKLISLGCALQNMLLAGQTLGYASGLASGGALDTPAMRHLLRLAAHERAVCFIGFGTAEAKKAPRQRPQPAQFFSTL